MKILKTSEFYFGLSGILVLNEESRSASIRTLLQNILFVFIEGPFFCGLAFPYILHNPDKVSNCIKTFVAICGAVLITGKYLTLVFNKQQIKKLILDLQQTVDDGL